MRAMSLRRILAAERKHGDNNKGRTARSKEELCPLEVTAASLGGVEALHRQITCPRAVVNLVHTLFNAL